MDGVVLLCKREEHRDLMTGDATRLLTILEDDAGEMDISRRYFFFSLALACPCSVLITPLCIRRSFH